MHDIVLYTTCFYPFSTVDTPALYNKSKLLLPNTLITDPQQIPNGLVCISREKDDEEGGFRFENGTTILGSRQGRSTTLQSTQLNQNGRYVCFDDEREWPLYIYLSNCECTLLGKATHTSQCT